MRLRTLILGSLLVLLYASCTHSLEGGDMQTEQDGSISIKLNSALQTETKSLTEAELPDVKDFTIEIYKKKTSGLVRLYRDSYENTVKKEKITLNSADYRVHARCGDSLGVGFRTIYFAAIEDVTVRPQTDETLYLEAKMASVKVAVNFGDDLKYDWDEYYAKVRTTTKGGRKRSLVFEKNETRAGYIPAGSFALELYIKVGDEWRYYPAKEEIELQPNDFVTFNVDTRKADGTFELTSRVERGTNLITKEQTLSSEWLPKDLPSINMLDYNGSDFGNSTFSFVEAGEAARSDLKADIVAPGRVKECWLEVTSDYLASLGVPSRVNLAGDIDPAVETALKSVGLKWMNGMEGMRLGYVDFSGITSWLEKVVYDSSNPFKATFSIEVIDQRQAVGETVSSPVTFVQNKPEFTLFDIRDYNCWGWKIDNITASMTTGNPARMVLEYKKSTEGADSWKVADPASDSGTMTKNYDIAGLTPGTVYDFRLRYNGNASTQITKSATTEVAAQVGNNSFEQHTYESFKTTKKLIISYGSEYITWYQPYKSGESDKWWAVNSSITLDANITPEYVTYKCFHTVSFTSGAHSGTRAAIVASIAVGDWDSELELERGDAKTGELFIGEADNSDEHMGNHLSEGHTFGSRPSSMTFWYKLDSHNSDPFSAEIRIMNSSGTTIGSATKNDLSASVSSWTQVTVPLNYNITTSKAGKIYIIFKSSATGSTASRKTSFTRLNSSGTETGSGNVHAGTIVWLDDVILNYE